ncbi:MAG: hypothetical protein EON98_03545 [Chitinophagaceae bacterium]|nr:MAG: hypothetical protein EON98_03545 [Chitinophagaceae bacterium]
MRLLSVFLLLLLVGCSTLQSSHTENVKAFARSAKVLSVVPGELYSDISSYRHQLKLIESSTIYSSDKIVPRLNKLLEVKAQFDQNAAQIHQSALLIESYAECLMALTDEGYQKQLGKEGDDLSLKLNAAIQSYNQSFQKSIPVNVGSFIGSVVTKIGSLKLRQLQKRYLKSFVDTGALVINDVCDYFTSTVAGSLENELSSLDNQFVNTMTTFYDNVYEYQKSQNINPYDYLKSYNPLYLDMKAKLELLHSLQQKMVAAMDRIKIAHEKLRLTVDLQQPTQMIEEIKQLYASTAEVQTAFKKLKE